MITRPTIFKEIDELRAACRQARAESKRVSVVPTMGALHEGHLSLVEKARCEGQFVVVTIFVNPAQFAPGEDFDKYPRQLQSDVDRVSEYSVDAVFAPRRSDIYPVDFATHVGVENLTRGLCGAHRKGHFDGVTTVVAKLFNIIGPCNAIFGRKDYQQLKVIEKMVTDLNMPVRIIGRPTVREPDGLALSSRNAYLSPRDRQRAVSISRGLKRAAGLFEEGERHVGTLRGEVHNVISSSTDEIDYVTAAHPDTLEALPDESLADSRLLIAVATRVGQTRLIDNSVLGENDIPGAYDM